MEQNQTRDEIEIDLRELFFALWSKKLIIVLAGVVVALAAFLFTKFFITPQYESVTKIYIQNKQESDFISYADLQSSSQMVNDYKELATSRPVAEEVITNLNLTDMTAEQLLDKITVTIPSDTRLLKITVRSEDQYEARDIANAVREAAGQHITNVMNVDAANVAEEASLPIDPSSPSTKKNVLLGGVVGVAIAVFVILLIYILDDTIKTPDDVEKYLEVAVLGNIPLVDQNGKGKKKKKRKPQQSQAKKKGGR